MANGAAKAGTGGFRADLAEGIEALSGLPLDGVRVQRNSERPAQLAAQAFAQGRDVHVAGEGAHLPHEDWHVVQETQGRVRPAGQLGGDVVSDDVGVEAEADRLGDAACRGAGFGETPVRR